MGAMNCHLKMVDLIPTKFSGRTVRVLQSIKNTAVIYNFFYLFSNFNFPSIVDASLKDKRQKKAASFVEMLKQNKFGESARLGFTALFFFILKYVKFLKII